MIVTKQTYIKGFFIVVLFLAVVRLLFPVVGRDETDNGEEYAADSLLVYGDSVDTEFESVDEFEEDLPGDGTSPENIEESADDVKWRKHRIYGVHSYRAAFPDNNDVQMSAAKRLGVSPVKDRVEAECRMNELVYIDNNPYYHVDHLTSSVPYLVPEAALLLHDIGRAFYDSLQAKGIPLHKPIVTSVLRTKDNIKKLRRRNSNATENSCHLYGTTFDISYLRYQTVSPPGEPQRRMVRNDTLKWILCEVMRDLRQQGRCFVKYEVKQACFHATVN